MSVKGSAFIAGKWSSGSTSATLFDSSTGGVLAEVPTADVDDAWLAASSASEAFAEWSTTPPAERADYLDRIADGIEIRGDELAEIVTREVGTPLSVSKLVHVALPAMSYRTAAGIARNHAFEHQVGHTTVIDEPVGVVAAITPWNYPPHQIAAKIAPALAAGCTVVLKPAALTALDAFLLAEVIEDSALPQGVFNLVSGPGRSVGEALVGHPLVDMVSFTGSTAAGAHIAALAAQSITRVSLELGGKSACILLDDLDDDAFKQAVVRAIGGCLLNAGQTCIALTRLVVPQDRLRLAEEIVVDQLERKWQPGDPFASDTRLGALASKSQVDSVVEYINVGIEEGARLLTGGPDRPSGLGDGYFVAPTAFTGENHMRIAQEEIFGPVLTIIPHRGDDHAVTIANDSPYGLSGAVWAADPGRAEAVARRVRTGGISVNGAMPNPNAPFGGFKQSGYGREYGQAGFDEFVETKSLHRP